MMLSATAVHSRSPIFRTGQLLAPSALESNSWPKSSVKWVDAKSNQRM
jgi:hypothetical protein